MSEVHGIKVILRNQQGYYVAGALEQGQLTDERAKARVFDYVQDRIREHIEAMQATAGGTWKAVRVDSREAYEVCDQCGRRVMSFKARFDGTRFLCADCAQRDRNPQSPRA